MTPSTTGPTKKSATGARSVSKKSRVTWSVARQAILESRRPRTRVSHGLRVANRSVVRRAMSRGMTASSRGCTNQLLRRRRDTVNAASPTAPRPTNQKASLPLPERAVEQPPDELASAALPESSSGLPESSGLLASGAAASGLAGPPSVSSHRTHGSWVVPTPPSASGPVWGQVELTQTPSWSLSGPAVLQEVPAAAPVVHSLGGGTSARARGAKATAARKAGTAKMVEYERRRIMV